MNEAGNGNCGEDESIPLMLIDEEAVVNVLFMYCSMTYYISLGSRNDIDKRPIDKFPSEEKIDIHV